MKTKPPEYAPLTLGSGGTQMPLEDEFVLVSWNINRGKLFDPVVAWLQQSAPDICLLQEVDVHARRTGFRDIPQELSQRLAMNFCFAVEFEELSQRGGNDPALHGNVSLSPAPLLAPAVQPFKHQLHDWNRYHLPFSWLQPRLGGRMALVTEIPARNKTLVTYNVHLESRANDQGRAQQMKEVIADLDNYPRSAPVIIAGDFNTHDGERSAVLEPLRAAGFQDVFSAHPPPVTTKVGRKQRLDWIFVRGLRVINAAVHQVCISDHYPLTARLAL